MNTKRFCSRIDNIKFLNGLLENKTERFNTISALGGTLAAVSGIVCLLSAAVRQGDPWKIVSFGVYGASLIAVFVFATLFHGTEGPAKAIFEKLDHLSIYLLIAGTYTPFTLVTLRDSVGWQIFVFVWGMALFGVFLDFRPKKGSRLLPVITYLVMGWSIIFALDPLLRVLPLGGFYYLLCGGLFYTVGVLFYALDDKVSYFHGIWHIFVILGSFSHYIAVLYYVA